MRRALPMTGLHPVVVGAVTAAARACSGRAPAARAAATSPATAGAANDVPLQRTQPVRHSGSMSIDGGLPVSSCPLTKAVATSSPTAQASTQGPELDQAATSPRCVSAPTPMTFGSAAGKAGRCDPAFPAAATKTVEGPNAAIC